MTRLLLLALLTLTARPAPWPRVDPETDWLVECLTGHFTGDTGEARGPELRADAVRIWRNRSDGQWIYLERGLDGQPSRPRQDVVQILHLEDGSFDLRFHALPDAEKYVGEWKREKPLVGLSPAKLSHREGCDVHVVEGDSVARFGDDSPLGPDDDPTGIVFTGQSEGECPSDVGDARTATTDLVIWPDAVLVRHRNWLSGHRLAGGKDASVMYERRE